MAVLGTGYLYYYELKCTHLLVPYGNFNLKSDTSKNLAIAGLNLALTNVLHKPTINNI